MTMHTIDFGVAHTAAVMYQSGHNFAATFWRKAPVGCKGHHQKISFGTCQRRIKAATGGTCRIKIIQCLGR